MARHGAFVVVSILLLGLAHAYVPDHVKRQLLTPDHDAVSKIHAAARIIFRPGLEKALEAGLRSPATYARSALVFGCYRRPARHCLASW